MLNLLVWVADCWHADSKSDTSVMLFYEFLIALVRIARLKYSQVRTTTQRRENRKQSVTDAVGRNQEPSLSMQLGRMLQRNIQPYAQRYFDTEYRAITQFMSMVTSPAVKV
jgi:hypothetical protein